jgi:hypothetical protein
VCGRHPRRLLIPCEPHRIFNGREPLSPGAKNRISQAVQFLYARQGQSNAGKIVKIRHLTRLAFVSPRIITAIIDGTCDQQRTSREIARCLDSLLSQRLPFD